MSIVRVQKLEALSDEQVESLLDRKVWQDIEVLESCREIIAHVRDEGDRAVAEYTRRFDGVDIEHYGLRVPARAFEDASVRLDRRLAQALDRALRNIRRLHETQVPRSLNLVEVDTGIWCGERSTPIESVCIYVPRGRGSFASVACMLGVPATLAGVERLIMCTPPGPNGQVDPATLFVARRLGIDEVYRVGGAQAVAAVAHGTQSVPQCDKIVGPGNVYVSAARQLLARSIDPGPPLGPSESLVLCDGSTDPENAAWNLMIEAEHGENSCALLLTHDPGKAATIAAAVDRLSVELTEQRRAFVAQVLTTRGGIVVTDSLEQSIEFSNRFAPESLALMVADPWPVLSRIKHAGEILIGDYPILSLANYAMGINAILPTGGGARSNSAVSVLDFMKRTSVGFVTHQGYKTLKRIVPRISADEGFSAHHKAIENWKPPAAGD